MPPPELEVEGDARAVVREPRAQAPVGLREPGPSRPTSIQMPAVNQLGLLQRRERRGGGRLRSASCASVAALS
jgi:hypothetical protein